MDERVMRRENERGRGVVDGRLADGGGRCTLVAVHYRSPRCWILYPYGAGKLGVVLNDQDATTLAKASSRACRRTTLPCAGHAAHITVRGHGKVLSSPRAGHDLPSNPGRQLDSPWSGLHGRRET